MGEQVEPLFKGLCSAFKILSQCFQALIEDGWNEVEQLADLTEGWKAHVLSLAPNGGQKRNLEKMLQRAEAGPLEEPVAKKRRRHEEVAPPVQMTPTQQESDKEQVAGPSGLSAAEAAAEQGAKEVTTSQVRETVHT